MTGSTFGAHGYTFTHDIDEPALAARVEHVLATLAVPAQTPSSTYRVTKNEHGRPVLWHDGTQVDVRRDEDNLLLLLHWHINQQVIARATERRTTFHAAAARSPDGAGVLLAAPMEAGKTTTATGLLRCGWDYLTDEAVAVDADGTMWAYPKPLTIDHGAWPLFPDLIPPGFSAPVLSQLVPATEAGARIARSAPLRLIAFPRYQAGADTEAHRLSASAAALELARSTFAFERFGARDLRVVARLARQVPAYRVTIGRLEAAVDLITELTALAAAA